MKRHTASIIQVYSAPLVLWAIIAPLAGCGDAVERVSETPVPIDSSSPTVVAQLNSQLQEAQTQNLPLRAILELNSADSMATLTLQMSISNGLATWDQTNLPIENPYDLTVRFEIATGGGAVEYLTVAHAQANHDFSSQPTKTFEADDFTTVFDADGDTMSNLDEFISGLNPQNDGPTFQTNGQFQVPEKQRQSNSGKLYYLDTVEAKSPRAGASLTYSLASGADKERFFIEPGTGKLSFVDTTSTAAPGGLPWPAYDAIGDNNYRVDIQVDDGTRSTVLSVTVTVTDVFNLTVTLGLKTLQFSWFAVPDATYYKLFENPDGNSGFNDVPGASGIKGLGFDYYFSLHRLDALNARYLLEAYDAGGNSIMVSDEFILSENLNSAIGYVKSTQTMAGDRFGQAVALSTDGTTLAVGAPYENSGAGAVYIYRRIAGMWQPHGVVTAPNIRANDNFGWAVAMSADGVTLAVGAPYENNKVGAVYVYQLVSGAWQSQGVVKAPNAETGDGFGTAVAISADGTILAVGATGEDSDTNVVIVPDPNAPTARPIPASKDNNNSQDSGAVYVYERKQGDNTKWENNDFVAYLKAPDNGYGDRFGWSVSLSANSTILAVGAVWEDSAATGVGGIPQDDCGSAKSQNCASNSGAVYVFEGTQNANTGGVNWATGNSPAYIKASSSGVDDAFGDVVALSADGATLAVGVRGDDSAATGVGGDPQDDCLSVNIKSINCAKDSGAVYVFKGALDATTGRMNWDTAPPAYIKATNTVAKDYFGGAMALSGNGSTLAVGANFEDSAATGVGGDQKDDCLELIGAPNLVALNCAQLSGAAYVYERAQGDSTRWDKGDFAAYVKAPNAEANDLFGQAVALSGDGGTLAVGAWSEGSSSTGVGGDQQDDCLIVSVDPPKNCAKNSGAVYLY